jgi:HD-GYP domain-containing protein (c-di-GMP phosphodiesterase class II)
VLALEPEPHALMSDAEFDAACLAMADFADLKSPYSVGHSRAVAALAGDAARRCGLPETDAVDLSRAGLLHDIGQVAVPARIWLKAGALNESEWEQVRLHSYYGERVLARPEALARLGAIVAQHHERLDGSGYHRGARAATLSPQGRILAAAEAYQNKIEARPHRAALSAQAAADALKRDVRAGLLDTQAVAAVLAAAGHRMPPRREMVAGLTEREIGVLRAIARGQSTKEIARVLGIAPKTVDNHTQSIFAKIGVKTRGGATLFAIEHGLCG